MGVTTGVVVNGQIVVSGEPLPEGKKVAVFVPGDERPYELTTSEAGELDRAIDEVREGNFVDGDDHLARLRDQG